MEDLIRRAHDYLEIMGCKGMRQQYFANEIKKMLADFAQQQLNLLNIPDVGSSLLLDEFNDIDTIGKCANCGVEFHIHKINHF